MRPANIFSILAGAILIGWAVSFIAKGGFRKYFIPEELPAGSKRRRSKIERRSNPLRFWSVVGLYLLLGLMFVYIGIAADFSG